MGFAKKIVAALFFSFLVAGFGFSDEAIDEDLRFEINLSDTVGTRLLNFSNCTDLGVDITAKDKYLILLKLCYKRRFNSFWFFHFVHSFIVLQNYNISTTAQLYPLELLSLLQTPPPSP